MSNTAGSNGAKSQAGAHEPTLQELEEELATLKRIQAIIEVEGFTDDRPLVEQFEERIKELREQLAEQQGHSTEPSVEPKKPEEENE